MKELICNPSGKVRYAGRGEAQSALALMRTKSKTFRAEFQVYACRICGDFHIVKRKRKPK